MRELKFTSRDLSYSDPNEDCYLDPADPIYSVMGMPAAPVTKTSESYFAQRNQAQAQGIRPGTPAWFAMTQQNRK
jgi:hypothetical protein